MIELSVAEATSLLDPWLSSRSIESVDLMTGGLRNRNYHLRLRGRPSDAVLRFYDADPSACAREVAVLGLLGRDCPVPRVLYVGDEDSATPHAVLSMVDGIALRTLRELGDADAIAEGASEAGKILNRLVQYPGPPTPYETVVSLVERFVAAPTFTARAGTGTARNLVALAERWQPRLDELSSSLGLVHGDFNSRNIFVKQTVDGWRVSGILDWEFALTASPYCDIGNFLRYHTAERPRFEPHFSRGLRDGGMQLPPDWLAIARLMDLPALCELVARPSLPDELVPELLTLLREQSPAI